MEIALILTGALMGVLCYRLGRREGEVGRVIPLRWRRTKRSKEEELLDKIERYRGRNVERKGNQYE